ncbi:hypothetical protein BKA61DRAFT_672205 [Leptodontidium sp. MPI-SDFR-AT-0119]|nr:hypothetical protein BKA61DRAFT_672205 [Leptodontidium sp. MPI-SDFR-AT-0119]
MASTFPSCQDSPLSVAANVTGILTFAYAVLAGLLAWLYLAGAFTSSSLKVYRSADGALQEHREKEVVTTHQILLIRKLHAAAISNPDSCGGTLRDILESYDETARMLLQALEKTKARRLSKLLSLKATLLGVQSQKDILALEQGLSMLREAIYFHVIMDIRSADQASRFKLEQSDRINSLEVAMKKMANVIKQLVDFQTAHV